MSYDRPTSKDVRRIFGQYEELVKEYGLIRPGYNLSLDIGSKTYGQAYRVYEVADRSLWGKKGDVSSWDDQYGSGQYEPTIGQNYLGMTAAEAWDALATRKRMIYDMSRAWGIEKTNPILDCGHFPTPTPSGSGGSGKAYDRDGASMCYACADDATRAEIADPTTDRISLYLATHPGIVKDEPWQRGYVRNFPITTWNGTTMGRVIESSLECVNYTPTGGRYSFFSITVRMDDGSMWYGRTSGPGMYVNLKRKKG